MSWHLNTVRHNNIVYSLRLVYYSLKSSSTNVFRPKRCFQIKKKKQKNVAIYNRCVNNKIHNANSLPCVRSEYKETAFLWVLPKVRLSSPVLFTINTHTHTHAHLYKRITIIRVRFKCYCNCRDNNVVKNKNIYFDKTIIIIVVNGTCTKRSLLTLQ